MSALPENAHETIHKNKFLSTAIETPDNALLTDNEVYNLKGGDKMFALKVVAGLGAVSLFLCLTKRCNELTKFNISGGTFFWSNVIMISTMSFTQKLYLKFYSDESRYKLHQLALFNRFITNMNEVYSNKKKPKFH